MDKSFFTIRFEMKLMIITFALIFHNVESKCTIEGKQELKSLNCIGTDMEELSSFFVFPNYFDNLYIVNSTLPQLELLPEIPSSRSYYKLTLTIKYSGLKIIILENVQIPSFLKLDLSYNELKTTDFLCSMKSVGRLNLSHNNIGHLNGSHFYQLQLEELDLSYNKIITFNKFRVDDRHSLMYVYLSNNFLKSLDDLLIDLTDLQNIDLSNNEINTITSSNFAKRLINNINVANNKLISFDSKIEVNHLDLSQNPLSELDISCPYLEYLNLSNSINNIQIQWHSKPNGKISIDFSKNNLTNLDFLLQQKFENYSTDKLKFNDNNLGSLASNIFRNFLINHLDLSNNNIAYMSEHAFGYVQIVDLSYNKLKQLSFSIFTGLTSLKRLNLSHNPLEILENSISPNVLENVHIDVLDLSFCFMNYLDVKILEGLHLKHLNLSHNTLNEKNTISSLNFKDLETLDLSSNGIVEFKSNMFDGSLSLRNLVLDNNYLEKIPEQFLTRQKNLDLLSLRGNNISEIDPEAFSYSLHLPIIDITLKGQIMPRSFFKLYNLRRLNIIDSTINIKNGSFRGLVNLVEIVLTNSNVSGIEPGAFEGLGNVGSLDFKIFFKSIDKIRTNTFLGLKKLNRLDLSHLGFKSLEKYGFSGLENLKILNLSRNNIKLYPENAFTGLNCLEELYLSEQGSESMENRVFSGLEMLRILNLSRNNFERLPRDVFESLKYLQILNLSYNNLTGDQLALPVGIFRDLKFLKELHLQYNKISNFSVGIFSSLEELRFLNLSHNEIRYLSRYVLFPLKKLEILDINSNNMLKFAYKFVLTHLPILKIIGIGSNDWNCRNLTVMLDNFQQNNVNYLKISNLEYDIANIDGICINDICL